MITANSIQLVTKQVAIVWACVAKTRQ